MVNFIYQNNPTVNFVFVQSGNKRKMRKSSRVSERTKKIKYSIEAFEWQTYLNLFLSVSAALEEEVVCHHCLSVSEPHP